MRDEERWTNVADADVTSPEEVASELPAGAIPAGLLEIVAFVAGTCLAW